MDIMSEMEKTVKRNALKWHAGQDIFCRCGSVLDCKRVVEIDAYKEDTLISSNILCSACWDKAKDQFTKIMAERSPHLRLDITDGRQLFGRAKKARKGDN
jgi:hypothetical protein